MPRTTTRTDKAFDFGGAYKELESIIEWFEREDPDIEAGLAKFERGLQLAKLCKERLKDVENKVVEIKAKFGQIGEETHDGAVS